MLISTEDERIERVKLFNDPFVDAGCYPQESTDGSLPCEDQQTADETRCGCMDPGAMEKWNIKFYKIVPEKQSTRERASQRYSNLKERVSTATTRTLNGGWTGLPDP